MADLAGGGSVSNLGSEYVPSGGNTIRFAAVPTRLDVEVKKVSDENGIRDRFVQYRKVGGVGLAPCTSTEAKLPPGIYQVGMTDMGLIFAPKAVITDSLMRFADSKTDEICRDIEAFWKMKSQFDKYGLTFKRGFFLHGPPGSGKTATISIVMERMVREGGIVLLNSSFDLVARGLDMLRDIEPERPVIVVWEDIDGMIGRGNEPIALALLDGELQFDNVVYIATTNYPERMEARFINRPSRFDKVVEIGMPSAIARRAYIESRIKQDMTQEDLTAWVQRTKGLSIAHIKELIISVYCYGVPFDASLERLQKMADTPKSEQYKHDSD